MKIIYSVQMISWRIIKELKPVISGLDLRLFWNDLKKESPPKVKIWDFFKKTQGDVITYVS